MINKIINSLVILILIVSAFSFIHLFKKKSNSNFSNLIIDVDSAFLDNDFIKTFLSNQISSDSLSVNFNSCFLNVITYSSILGSIIFFLDIFIK